ncbi:MAG: ABC transporter ATP-binding protein [Pirellulales bacterium]
MASIIELSSVTKRFRGRPALSDVSLSIPAGIIGLLGPNGSGKSTMIKILLGLVRPSSGKASVLGMSLPRQIRSIRDRVGYMPEDDCFVAGLSGIESIQMMARLSGLPGREGLRRAHEILDFSEIGQERYRMVETYSTGMRQKLKFAQALVHDPALLILDEPTTGLDPEQRIAMLRRIKHLAEQHGKSVMLSTHILHDVREVCRSVVILAKGTVRVVDTLERLSRPQRAGLQVGLFGDASAFGRSLKARGVESETQSPDSLWVYGVDESNTRVLWQAAEEASVLISQVTTGANSLEDIFFRAVTESHHAAP